MVEARHAALSGVRATTGAGTRGCPRARGRHACSGVRLAQNGLGAPARAGPTSENRILSGGVSCEGGHYPPYVVRVKIVKSSIQPAPQPDGDTPEAVLRGAERTPQILRAHVPARVYDMVLKEADERGMSAAAFVRAAVRLFLRKLGHDV